MSKQCRKLYRIFSELETQENDLKDRVLSIRKSLPKVIFIDEADMAAELIRVKIDDMLNGTNDLSKVKEAQAWLRQERYDTFLERRRKTEEFRNLEDELELVTTEKRKVYERLQNEIKLAAQGRLETMKIDFLKQLLAFADDMATLAATEKLAGIDLSFNRFLVTITGLCPWGGVDHEMKKACDSVADRMEALRHDLVGVTR